MIGQRSSARSNWYSHGFWNVLEHGLSRGLDAFATIAIVWLVPTTVFSQLALAQAYVATALFFFIAPETALYRHFSEWSNEGRGALLTRIRAFRRFAWGKALVAILVSAAIACIAPSPEGTQFGFLDRFSALVWAFSLPLLPQVSGADREFLRLSLDLRVLNGITVFQRAAYLLLLVPIVKLHPTSFSLVAFSGVGTMLLTSWLSRHQVEKKFRGVTPSKVPEGNGFAIVRNALKGFSFWNHVSGVITGWIQTLDLFFLGVFRLPAATLGIYSVVLKLSGFTLALPYAIANLYQVYLGRTSEGGKEEVRKLVRFSFGLTALCVFQATVLFLLSPWVLSVFSRGRWTPEEQVRMARWLGAILPACTIFGSALFWNGWLLIRRSVQRLVLWVYLPWGAGSLVIYAWTAKVRGVDAVAHANLAVGALFVILLAFSSLFAMTRGSGKAG